MQARDFTEVKNEEEMKEEEEKRKESRLASKEEIEEEMKVSLADRVTPYHALSYKEQIEKKKEQLIEILKSYSSALEKDIK